MGEDIEFERVAPVIPVRDLDAAIPRYGRMGFRAFAYGGPDRYGYAVRCGAGWNCA